MVSLITDNLSITIGNKKICQNLNVSMRGGEFWVILGANGVGKTTLLHTLAGLRKPEHGEVLLNDNAITTLPKRTIAQQLGILLQNDHYDFPATLFETVLTGRYPHINKWHFESSEDLDIAKQALAAMELTSYAQRKVTTLSGGELQRLRLATLLTQTPQIYLLDEPLTNLDPKYQILILEHFYKLTRQHNHLVVVVGHELHLLKQLNPKVILVFEDGEIVVDVIHNDLPDSILHKLYGQLASSYLKN